jgi:hypothetical protein
VKVIVVRAPTIPIDLRYGGVPLLSPGEEGGTNALVPVPEEAGTGTLLGKRYVHEASGLELLCVKAGAGTLSVDHEPLPLKRAKQLPASD